MPTPCAGGVPRHSQPRAKLSALGTVKSCSAHASCTPLPEAQSILPPGLGLVLLAEGSFFGWQEQKGHQNQGEESGPGLGPLQQVGAQLAEPPGASQLPILHHPAAAGFPQALTCFPRPPVTISGGFVPVKATPEATGCLPRLSADLHTFIPAQPSPAHQNSNRSKEEITQLFSCYCRICR